MMKKMISLILFILLVALVGISASAIEYPKISRQEIESYEKDSFFTVMPEIFRKEVLVWYDHLFPLRQSKEPIRFLRTYFKGETVFYFDWETPIREILEQNTPEGDKRVFSWLAFTDSAFDYFALVSNSQGITDVDMDTHLPDFPSWLAELRSIDKYMVFENEICTVQEVIPVVLYMEGRGILFFYFTDRGNYVKCFLSDWVHKEDYNGFAEDVVLWFTLDEFHQTTEALYSELRVEWAELMESGNIPIGGPPTNLPKDMRAAGMELPICEAGNPIPAHLQAEIDALRGADEKDATETTDSDDKTSDSGTVTDVPVDEGTDNAEGVTDPSDTANTETATGTADNSAITDQTPPPDGTATTDCFEVPTETLPPTATGTPNNATPFPWLWVVLPVATVLAGGAVAFVLICKKKKEN